jgi:hypothetical protein
MIEIKKEKENKSIEVYIFSIYMIRRASETGVTENIRFTSTKQRLEKNWQIAK